MVFSINITHKKGDVKYIPRKIYKQIRSMKFSDLIHLKHISETFHQESKSY